MFWANPLVLGIGTMLLSVPIILHFMMQPKPKVFAKLIIGTGEQKVENVVVLVTITLPAHARLFEEIGLERAAGQQ